MLKLFSKPQGTTLRNGRIKGHQVVGGVATPRVSDATPTSPAFSHISLPKVARSGRPHTPVHLALHAATATHYTPTLFPFQGVVGPGFVTNLTTVRSLTRQVHGMLVAGGVWGRGEVGTRPWWLALLACGGAYWPPLNLLL